ncbi:hypothetical protein [Streptomyces sp. NPDC051546]|uniref:hypothetical protein n=1 Tax=Streptomyces sp. NPDC051546 TaxID=3365655 RepID=UPI0037B7C083
MSKISARPRVAASDAPSPVERGSAMSSSTPAVTKSSVAIQALEAPGQPLNIDTAVAAIRGIKLDGLTWGTIQQTDGPFGTKGVQAAFVIEDSKFETTDVIYDEVESLGLSPEGKTAFLAAKASGSADDLDLEEDPQFAGKLFGELRVLSYNKL